MVGNSSKRFFDDENLNKILYQLKSIINDVCRHRRNEIDLANIANDYMEYFNKDQNYSSFDIERKKEVAFSVLRSYKDYVHMHKKKLLIDFNKIIDKEKLDSSKKKILLETDILGNPEYLMCWDVYTSKNLKGLKGYLISGKKRYNNEKGSNKGRYRNLNKNNDIGNILTNGTINIEAVKILYSELIAYKLGTYDYSGLYIPPTIQYKKLGGRSKISKKKSVKKKLVKKTSVKKKSVKKKSTPKKKKSVKKTSATKKKKSVKKVSDKRIGIYKHKGHTHRTKKALNSCTQ